MHKREYAPRLARSTQASRLLNKKLGTQHAPSCTPALCLDPKARPPFNPARIQSAANVVYNPAAPRRGTTTPVSLLPYPPLPSPHDRNAHDMT